MAKRVQVIEKFSIGKNTYDVGSIYTFSDELALKNSAYLTEDIEEVKEVEKTVSPKKSTAKKNIKSKEEE